MYLERASVSDTVIGRSPIESAKRPGMEQPKDILHQTRSKNNTAISTGFRQGYQVNGCPASAIGENSIRDAPRRCDIRRVSEMAGI